ncbi:MAG: YbaK/EbsC family protein [Spirochaetota bacterium]|nr:MAG: YbaK/EbsC family protein [Spirochaetota bacterium]
MQESLSSSAKKVQKTLQSLGFEYDVVVLPDTTRSAKDAASAIGCSVDQIAKSIIFKAMRSEKPILVIACGSNRVNEKTISEYLSEPVGKADADFVRENTGFSIGGVPPIGHSQNIHTFLDEDLLKYEEIWAAAGTPHAVFRLLPADLVKMTNAKVVSIT